MYAVIWRTLKEDVVYRTPGIQYRFFKEEKNAKGLYISLIENENATELMLTDITFSDPAKADVLFEYSLDFYTREQIIEEVSKKDWVNFAQRVRTNLETQTATIYRVDNFVGEPLIVPFSVFKETGLGEKPDFTKPFILDSGRTVVFGKYEASMDAINYECDPEWRAKKALERPEEDRTFSKCVRRCMMQKGHSVEEFEQYLWKVLLKRMDLGHLPEDNSDVVEACLKFLELPNYEDLMTW